MIARVIRAVAVGAVVGLTGFGLAAVKVLPGLELMAVSNRVGGLSLQDAAGFVNEFTEPALLNAIEFGATALRDLRHLLLLTMSLCLFGALGGLVNKDLRWITLAAILLVAAGIAIAHSQATFAMLWRLLPMFRYQRIPQRALVLAYLGLSVLISIGVWHIIAHWRSRILAWIVGSTLLLLVSAEAWIAIPPVPPSADIRLEVRENSVLNHMAQQTGQFRIHAIESVDRNWGIEHVTVPLKLKNLVGWDHLWLLEYLGAEGTIGRDVRPFVAASYESRHPARFWGMMNVRFVTSTRQVQVPGFEFVAQFPISPRSQPAKSAGPYLYENSQFLPRAWVVPRAILVLGDRAERIEAGYKLMDHVDFDPRQTVVIQSESTITKSGGDWDQYQAIAIPARWANTETIKSLEQAGVRLLRYGMQGSGNRRQFQWAAPDEVTLLLEGASGTVQPETTGDSDFPAYESPNPNRARVRVAGREGFLVLSEKFAHFPGWSAQADGNARVLLRANGVATAVRLDGTEDWIEFRYWPAGLTLGLGITLASLLLVPLIGRMGDRLVNPLGKALPTPFVRQSHARLRRGALRCSAPA
jgi:hypothetical protein